VLLAPFQGYGLQPGPLLFELLGAWSVNGSTADLVILLVIGLVGMILGPLSEQQLRRALAISQGDPSVLLTRPISAALLAITAAVLVAPALLRVVARARR
jgi:putative tricarboxylic transport membrane protein